MTISETRIDVSSDPGALFFLGIHESHVFSPFSGTYPASWPDAVKIPQDALVCQSGLLVEAPKIRGHEIGNFFEAMMILPGTPQEVCRRVTKALFTEVRRREDLDWQRTADRWIETGRIQQLLAKVVAESLQSRQGLTIVRLTMTKTNSKGNQGLMNEMRSSGEYDAFLKQI